MEHDLVIKISPNELRQPHTLACIALKHGFVSGLGQCSNGDGAKAQMHTQVTWPFGKGKVAAILVVSHALFEVFEELMCTLRALRNTQAAQVGAFKSNLLKRWWLSLFKPFGSFAPLSQNGCVNWVQVMGGDFFQPSIFIRSEHAVGLAQLAEYLVYLEDDMVFVGFK